MKANKQPWTCKSCGRESKSQPQRCPKCLHEPVLGRRDHDPEGRKYDPDKEPSHD